MRYCDFRLVEGYKEVTQRFAQEADPQAVQQMINKYRDLVNRNQVQGNERNIDWWGKQGWQSFAKFVDAKTQQPSQTQQKKRKSVGNSHVLEETNEWLIVVPLDKDASCFHGKGTDWCTAKPQQDNFEQYFRDDNVTLIYFLQKQTGKKWACAVHAEGKEEWFDINDKSIRISDFSKQTGISLETANKYVSMVLDRSSDVSKKADASRSDMRKQNEILADMIDKLSRSNSKERSAEIETLIIKSKSSKLLKDYVYIVANDENNPVDFDQNMQTLIALKLPHMMKNIANLSEKSAKIGTKGNPTNLKYVRNPSPDLMKFNIKQTPWAINYVNPEFITPELKKFSLDLIFENLTKEEYEDDEDVWAEPITIQYLEKLFNKFGIEDEVFVSLIKKYKDSAATIFGMFLLDEPKARSQPVIDEILKFKPDFKNVLGTN
jgi:hypothetical protein